MFRHRRSRVHLLFLFSLAALPGCRNDGDSPVGPRAQFAQGDNGLWTVNKLVDPGDGSCDDTECTLREAIEAAAPGDKIVFQGSLQGDIPLAAGQLSIEKSLTIDGAGRIAVDAQHNSRVISVASAQSQPTVTLAGLTFKNGSADGGAGISVGISSLTLDGVRVSHNESTSDGGGISVGLVNSLIILNSTIVDNTAAGDGGGIYVSGGGRLTLTNSTIDSNTATTDGGGMFMAGGQVSVLGSTFSGNLATHGGGLSNGNGSGTPTPAGGVLAIRSSTITANRGTGGGGGVAHGGSGGNRTTLANSIVAGNTSNDCSLPSGGSSSLGHNLGGCASLFTAGGDVIVQPTQVFTEVLEQALADNGGPTPTHALIARGRAADRGYCPGETADQRGIGRPVDDPAMPNALDGCDIGAYELQGPVAIVADLMISQNVNKTSVKQGELLTYSIRVQNLGPETAPKVVVTDLLPTGATFVEAKHNKGTHTAPPKGETGTVTWSVGDLLDQANEVATITVTVLVKGKTSITNNASGTGDVTDPNQANNSSAITVSVAAGSKPTPKK